jgi:hypothetical protein
VQAVEGGELAFVTQMLRESLGVKTSVLWFTSMFGKKANMTSFVARAYEAGASICRSISLVQGRTRRWVVGWTFFPVEEFCDAPLSDIDRGGASESSSYVDMWTPEEVVPGEPEAESGTMDAPTSIVGTKRARPQELFVSIAHCRWFAIPIEASAHIEQAVARPMSGALSFSFQAAVPPELSLQAALPIPTVADLVGRIRDMLRSMPTSGPDAGQVISHVENPSCCILQAQNRSVLANFLVRITPSTGQKTLLLAVLLVTWRETPFAVAVCCRNLTDSTMDTGAAAVFDRFFDRLLAVTLRTSRKWRRLLKRDDDS